MKLINLIREITFEKSKAESKITELGLPVLYHMIKIIKWEDKDNYFKYINDIDNLITDIQDVVIKPEGKRFKPEQYYRFLFKEQIHSEIDITKKINSVKLKQYKNLKALNTDKKVYDILNFIYNKISIDLSNNEFETIKKYLTRK
jgi:hypothetical protein